MRPVTSLTIPQPCSESWAAMSPTAAGRHCAACSKTVVDFTLKTDAEILAYLAGAAAGRTCGHFAAGQLERPLQRAVPVAPAARWRAWLAAIVAVWAVREGISAEAKAQAATEWHARYWGGPVPAAPVGASPAQKPGGVGASLAAPAVGDSKVLCRLPRIQNFPDHLDSLIKTPRVLRGKVADFANQKGLPGVTILLKGTTIGTSTNTDGIFELSISPDAARLVDWTVTVYCIGYVAQEYRLRPSAVEPAQNFQLKADTRLLGEVVITGTIQQRALPPAPWHPRAFYSWGKYWLARPFRRG